MELPGSTPRLRVCALFIAIGCAPATAENIDPDNDDSQYGWAENVGWFNAEPASCGVQVADFDLSGYLWGENIGWINLSCTNNSTCGTVSYGVTNDGHGNLGGFAWAENAGWVTLPHREGRFYFEDMVVAWGPKLDYPPRQYYAYTC